MSFRRAALIVAVADLARAVAPGAAALGEEPPPAPATPAEDPFLAEAEPMPASHTPEEPNPPPVAPRS